MKRLHIILLSAALLLSLSASAQSFRSGYFLDNYVYGYRINPAQVNDRGFLGLAIGNIDLQNNSNIGISSLLYPTGNGHLVTGLNKAVPAETFLGNLKNNNYISLDESFNILALGISNGKTMHTIELNARAMVGFNMPKSLFKLAKQGGTGTFDIGNLYTGASLLADLAYGFSTHIGDNFSIGARLHFLLGTLNASVSANNSTLSVSENEINVSPSVDLRTTGLVSVIPKIEAGIPGISGVEIGNPVGGYGGALDLGVDFKSNFGLEAMLSVTDLGAISWINSKYAIAQGDFTYNGIKMELDGNTIKTDIDEIMDRLSNSFTINTGTAAPSLELMPFNVAAGVRYYMPFYEGLSVGALATYHYAKYSSWFDARAGATITPGRFLSFSGNIGYSSFGTVWGTGLNLCLGPINLLVGLDSHIGKMGKIYGIPVPIDRFVDNVHLGLTITF